MKICVLTAQVGHYHLARYRAAASRFARFEVLSVANSADFPEFMASSNAGIVIHRLYDGTCRYQAAVRDGLVWGDVFASLNRLRPDVVAVAGWATPESFAAIAWARKRGAGLVMLSESQWRDASRCFLSEALKRKILGCCGAALVGGVRHRDYLVRLGFSPNSISLGYNAVDNRHFEAGADIARQCPATTRRLYGMPHDYVLASARFIEKKNLPGLVRAYATAIDGNPLAPCLVILGDGPARPAIEREVRKCKQADKVLLPGFRGYAALPAWYALARGFLHAARVEQWGLVINEAAAAGIPIIATSSCGASESLIEPGRNGYLVPPDDEPALALAIDQLLGTPAAVRAEMGRASRELVRPWGPKRFADGLLMAARQARMAPARRAGIVLPSVLRALSYRVITRVA